MAGLGLDPIPGLSRLTPDQAYLAVQNGPRSRQEFSLAASRIVVGRNDPPHLTVDLDLSACELGNPPMVSRRHALLQWNQGTLEVIDLGSRNGTFVNDQRLDPLPNQPYSAPVPLQRGSRLRFGNLELDVISHA